LWLKKAKDGADKGDRLTRLYIASVQPMPVPEFNDCSFARVGCPPSTSTTTATYPAGWRAKWQVGPRFIDLHDNTYGLPVFTATHNFLGDPLCIGLSEIPLVVSDTDLAHVFPSHATCCRKPTLLRPRLIRSDKKCVLIRYALSVRYPDIPA
jgi:hypothetical protein